MSCFTNNVIVVHCKYFISDKTEERTGRERAKEKGKS
jgi:hypothetical protein